MGENPRANKPQVQLYPTLGEPVATDMFDTHELFGQLPLEIVDIILSYLDFDSMVTLSLFDSRVLTDYAQRQTQHLHDFLIALFPKQCHVTHFIAAMAYKISKNMPQLVSAKNIVLNNDVISDDVYFWSPRREEVVPGPSLYVLDLDFQPIIDHNVRCYSDGTLHYVVKKSIMYIFDRDGEFLELRKWYF